MSNNNSNDGIGFLVCIGLTVLIWWGIDSCQEKKEINQQEKQRQEELDRAYEERSKERFEQLLEEWNRYYNSAQNMAINFVKGEGYNIQKIDYIGNRPEGSIGNPTYLFNVTTSNVSSSGGLINIWIGIEGGNNMAVTTFKAFTQ